MSSKMVADAREALADVGDGARIMVGGFGLSGNPEHCIRELHRKGAKGLTIIANNIGNQGRGLAVLLKARQVTGAVCGGVPLAGWIAV